METLGVDYLTKQQYNLLGGDHDPVQIPVTIVSGAGALLGGTVLGRITASGKYTPYSATHTDGSEVARVILARDIDATSADAAVSAYVHGEFNKNAMTGLDAAAILKLQEFGMYIREVK